MYLLDGYFREQLRVNHDDGPKECRQGGGTQRGGPYGQVTRDNFGRPGVCDYRNPNLAAVMKELGYVQRFGMGIPLASEGNGGQRKPRTGEARVSVPVLTFFNNKGGVGKTSMVLHMAWMYEDLGYSILAADLGNPATTRKTA